MNRFIGLLLGAVLWAGVAWGASPATQPAGSVKVTLLHINDPHGQLEPKTVGGGSVGGYARLSTLVSEIRAASEPGSVLLVHGGDEFSRGDSLTVASKGLANIDILNLLKFDAYVPGNGDYYDGVGTLQARIARAKFPTLAANVTVKASGKELAKPYVVLSAGPARVALLGLCFVHTDRPAGGAVDVADPADTAAKLVPELRKQADVVVAVTHIGYDQDMQLATKVDGLDIIVGAHTHTKLPEGKVVRKAGGKQTLVCQAGDLLRLLGRVDLTLEGDGGRYKLTSAKARLIDIDGDVKIDPAVTALIAKWSATTQPSRPKARQAEPVGAGAP